MLRSRQVGRRTALKTMGLLLGALMAPSVALAKKRRRKPAKKKSPEPAATTEPAAAGGDALKDAQLSKPDGVWELKNKSQTQRIVVLLRHQPPGANRSLHAFSLEPAQEVSLGVKQPEGVNKPVITIVSAQYN